MLRALLRAPTAAEKMALHARVEETAWSLPVDLVALVEGREPDDGVPPTPEWQGLVAALAAELPRKA